MKPSRFGGLALGWLAAVSLQVPAQAGEAPDRAVLEVGGWQVAAEIAATPEARSTGLMRRERLPEDQGMLFVNPRGQLACMWMKDTPIPLAVAFLDADGVVLYIAEMQPHSLDIHCSPGTSGYALEMNAGWFGKRGIGPGARFSGLDAVRR